MKRAPSSNRLGGIRAGESEAAVEPSADATKLSRASTQAPSTMNVVRRRFLAPPPASPLTPRALRDEQQIPTSAAPDYLVSLDEYLESAGLTMEGYRKMRLRGEGPREVLRLRREVFVVLQANGEWLPTR